MTIVASMKVKDGLVLATDSMSTIFTSDGKFLKSYSNTRKLFQFKDCPIGIMSWGLGNIGNRSIEGLLLDFTRKHYPEHERVDVKQVAEKFFVFIGEKYTEYFYPILSKTQESNRLTLKNLQTEKDQTEKREEELSKRIESEEITEEEFNEYQTLENKIMFSNFRIVQLEQTILQHSYKIIMLDLLILGLKKLETSNESELVEIEQALNSKDKEKDEIINKHKEQKINFLKLDNLGILIGGYTDGSQFTEQYEFLLPADLNIKEVMSNDNFGPSWRGVREVFDRLYFGLDLNIYTDLKLKNVDDGILDEVFFSSKYNMDFEFTCMPLKEAISFVIFILKTTISASYFMKGAPPCGEPIQLVVISPYEKDKWQWVHNLDLTE